jgi:hypothetical protein
MFIHSHFSSFSPRLPRWSAPMRDACCHCGGPSESALFSSQANMFMLMNALSATIGGFQGSAPMSKYQSPSFGRPGGFGPFGPTQCFLGPSIRPQQAPPRVTSPARPVATPTQAASPGGASVRPMAQSNSVSCGQTSVAMAVNSLTGKSLTDRDISKRYGFGLLSALNGESRGSGYSWRDGGNFNSGKWSLLEQKLNKEKTPVIIGLNGPQFSPSGRGHIVTLMSVNGNQVKYADPADGKIKTTTRQAIERAPSHPDGKFIFYAKR